MDTSRKRRAGRLAAALLLAAGLGGCVYAPPYAYDTYYPSYSYPAYYGYPTYVGPPVALNFGYGYYRNHHSYRGHYRGYHGGYRGGYHGGYRHGGGHGRGR